MPLKYSTHVRSLNAPIKCSTATDIFFVYKAGTDPKQEQIWNGFKNYCSLHQVGKNFHNFNSLLIYAIQDTVIILNIYRWFQLPTSKSTSTIIRHHLPTPRHPCQVRYASVVHMIIIIKNIACYHLSAIIWSILPIPLLFFCTHFSDLLCSFHPDLLTMNHFYISTPIFLLLSTQIFPLYSALPHLYPLTFTPLQSYLFITYMPDWSNIIDLSPLLSTPLAWTISCFSMHPLLVLEQIGLDNLAQLCSVLCSS